MFNLGILDIYLKLSTSSVGNTGLSALKVWHFVGLILLSVAVFFISKKVYKLGKGFRPGIILSVLLVSLLEMYSYFVLWSMELCSSHTYIILLCFAIGFILLTILLTYLIPQKVFDKLESKDKTEE